MRSSFVTAMLLILLCGQASLAVGALAAVILKDWGTVETATAVTRPQSTPL